MIYMDYTIHKYRSQTHDGILSLPYSSVAERLGRRCRKPPNTARGVGKDLHMCYSPTHAGHAYDLRGLSRVGETVQRFSLLCHRPRP